MITLIDGGNADGTEKDKGISQWFWTLNSVDNWWICAEWRFEFEYRKISELSTHEKYIFNFDQQ